jgi:hypothetical protein|tara:strand:+ start:8809 stop:9123 length:315 start_codon:yes stop_codon:yes gene_type:complete
MTKIFIEDLDNKHIDVEIPDFSYQCTKEIRYLQAIKSTRSAKKLKRVMRASVDGETFRENQNRELEGMCDLTDGQISRMAWCIRCQGQQCVRQTVFDILEEGKE